MVSQTRSTRGQENSAQPHLVFINDDPLTEILIRLPILCIHLLQPYKHCYIPLTLISLIDTGKSLSLNPPADPRLESRKSAMDNSFTLAQLWKLIMVNILQSSNGLLLCMVGSPAIIAYIIHPLNLFKRLPQPENSHDVSILHATGVFRMAFDLTKSRDYKVVQLFACLHAELEIQVYSSKTGNWSMCRDWLTLYKFHIDDHGHTIITTLEIPNGFHQGSNFLQLFGAREVVTQKVQTKAFPAKSPIPIRNCILGLAAAHTWACTGNKTFKRRKPKDAIVAGKARKGKKKV
ncbi:hypothetical protein Tco_0012080 [Tanacetum coccineum]